MGAKLRKLSGHDLVATFEQFGFTVISQKGSHIKMRRMLISGTETLLIPRACGASKRYASYKIFGQAARYIPREDLYTHFYTSAQ